jgi:hypothetical protein
MKLFRLFDSILRADSQHPITNFQPEPASSFTSNLQATITNKQKSYLQQIIQKQFIRGKPAEIKTQQNEASVEDFINTLKDERQRLDSLRIVELMKKESGEEPKMWGASLIGFGTKRYKSPKTGREVDWFHIGFSPRKANI